MSQRKEPNYYIDGRLTEKTDKRVQERMKKLKKELLAFASLFSGEQIDNILKVFQQNLEINFCSNYAPLKINALSDVKEVGYNTQSGVLKRLSLSDKATPFITKHECWHAFMLPKQLYAYNNCISGHGCQVYTRSSFDAYVRSGGKSPLFGYGNPFEEGMANITAVLATIKDKAKVKDDFLEADKYMATGQVGSALNGVFRGYFLPLEDITRLFILASRNDYMLTHPFSEVLASKEGIDGQIGSPVNKPYCSFISSAVKGDFRFQSEFDTCIHAYNKRENKKLPDYVEISGWIDRTQMNSILRENKITDIDGWKKIIETLQIFYTEKMKKCIEKGFIDEKRKTQLLKEFNNSCEIVEKNLEGRVLEGR